MQQVVSIPNSDYKVNPLATVATTIVSRTKTRIPFNSPGPYGPPNPPNGAPNYATDARVTFGNNEAGFLPRNMLLQMDFTPYWYNTTYDNDTTTAIPSLAVHDLLPSFDGSVHSIIESLELRTPQGLSIDALPQFYNKLVAINDLFMNDVQGREMNLFNMTSYDKNVLKSKGTNTLIDGFRGSEYTTGCLTHGKTKRLLFHPKCPAQDSIPFDALFLNRNGKELNLRFERPEKAFVYQEANHAHVSCPIYPSHIGVNVTGQKNPTNIRWMLGEGTIGLDGVAMTAIAGVDTTGIGNYVLRNAATAFTRANPPDIAGGAGGPLSFYKSTLLVDDGIGAKLIQSIREHCGVGATYRKMTGAMLTEQYGGTSCICCPISIYRDGHLHWRGFTAISLNILLAKAGVTAYIPHSGDEEEPAAAAEHRAANAAKFVLNRNDQRIAFAHPQANNTQLVETGLVTQHMIQLPLYNWSHFDDKQGNVYGFNSIPPACFTNTDYNTDYYVDFFKSKNELVIDYNNLFVLSLTEIGDRVSLPTGHNLADPRIAHVTSMAKRDRTLLTPYYKIENPMLIMDWIKPSTDIVKSFITAFNSPTGIAYPVKRFQYYQRVLDAAVTGSQQIVIQTSVRSLDTIFVWFTDPFHDQPTGVSSMFFPCLTSMMRRGLHSAEIVIGGARKPEYQLTFDTDEGIEHLPETCNGFNLSTSEGFRPSFHRISLGKIRNYLATGNLGIPAATLSAKWSGRSVPTKDITGYTNVKSNGLDYIDSSSFALAISLAKKDGQFACGLDTSMSGNVALNLTFSKDAAPTKDGATYDPGSYLGRSINVNILTRFDAVLDYQVDSSTVRW